MAQASLIGMRDFYGLGDELLDEDEPAELGAVNDAVLAGYTGRRCADIGRLAQAFSAMGYHLGSELLADREFSLIDEHLRQHRSDLVQHLMRSSATLAGAAHRCYAWVGVHSGHGAAVEADHFEHAAQGVRHALRYIAAGSASQAMDALVAGFREFDQHHARFFRMGGRD